jgi:hypothetical protein
MNNQALLIALLATVISPSILAIITNVFRRIEKREDWKREDKKEKEKAEKAEEVAKQAERAAKLLLESNERIAAAAAESTKSTNAKLEVIRVDVNSNMTAAMKAELDATEGQVALLREVVELKKVAGTNPTKQALAYIESKEMRINELKATLKDRLTHTSAAAAAAADSQT